QVEIEGPAVPVVANVVAEPVTDPATIRSLLVDQICGSVRWRESVQFMAAQGVCETWELGAGKALSGMVKRIDRSVAAKAVNTAADVRSAAETILAQS
ncbi:MAG: malonyl CoA-acyl carrier protein transacylase, partial [Primorskyibacter sp.]